MHVLNEHKRWRRTKWTLTYIEKHAGAEGTEMKSEEMNIKYWKRKKKTRDEVNNRLVRRRFRATSFFNIQIIIRVNISLAA